MFDFLLRALVCLFRLGRGKSCAISVPGFTTSGYSCQDTRACEGLAISGNATFSQLIDHSQPKLGTFDQLFYWNTLHWNEQDPKHAPIILYLGGDKSIAGMGQDLQGNETLVEAIAERLGAAIILLEHRFWGNSHPFEIATTSNLKYLTIEQGLGDIAYFAENVELPFLPSNGEQHVTASNTKAAPWILIGGGYAGALTVWTSQRTPATFWAHVASSPMTVATDRFSQFDDAAVKYGPKNCTKDVDRVIRYVDTVLQHGTKEDIQTLKSEFGIHLLQDDDFAFVLHIGPLQWAESSVTRPSSYMQFCDYVEGVAEQPNAELPDENGVGLQRALSGYAAYVSLLKQFCERAGYTEYQGQGNNTGCWDTYDPENPKFTDISFNDGAVRRQWKWLTCNEPYASWPAPAPAGRPSLMSRFVTPERYARECRLTFPEGEGEGFGHKLGGTFNDFNAKYDGWNISPKSHRLIYSNGEMDPYFALSISSPDRPGGPSNDTDDIRVFVHPGGSKDDLFMPQSDYSHELRAVQNAEIEQLASWIADYWTHDSRTSA